MLSYSILLLLQLLVQVEYFFVLLVDGAFVLLFGDGKVLVLLLDRVQLFLKLSA